jgi:AraC-like DNA-binding protein
MGRMEMADGTIACDQCMVDLHADPRYGDLGNQTGNGKFCDDCYEVWLRTPRVEPAEPVLVWRDRPQEIKRTEPEPERWYEVAEVAGILHLSRSQVSKIFKKELAKGNPGVKDCAGSEGKRPGRKWHKALLRISQSAVERVRARRK